MSRNRLMEAAGRGLVPKSPLIFFNIIVGEVIVCLFLTDRPCHAAHGSVQILQRFLMAPRMNPRIPVRPHAAEWLAAVNNQPGLCTKKTPPHKHHPLWLPCSPPLSCRARITSALQHPVPSDTSCLLPPDVTVAPNIYLAHEQLYAEGTPASHWTHMATEAQKEHTPWPTVGTWPRRCCRGAAAAGRDWAAAHCCSWRCWELLRNLLSEKNGSNFQRLVIPRGNPPTRAAFKMPIDSPPG